MTEWSGLLPQSAAENPGPYPLSRRVRLDQDGANLRPPARGDGGRIDFCLSVPRRDQNAFYHRANR